MEGKQIIGSESTTIDGSETTAIHETEPTVVEKLKSQHILFRRSGLFVNGVEVGHVPLNIPSDEHIRNIRAMEMRDDDVFVAAYPKCGTHWTWEVVLMLRNQITTFDARAKEHVMLELIPTSTIAAQLSPRTINSHLYIAHLPEAIVCKKIKILHVVRNPKDTLVSMYYHHKQMDDDLHFDDVIQYMTSTDGVYETQFNYMRQLYKFQQEHPDHPIKTIYYENMKKNPVGATKEIADFLEIPASMELCKGIAEACGFQKMKQADKTKDFPSHIMEHFGADKPVPQFYRKGVIGDWKTHFTVAQNEKFEAHVEEELGGLPYKFIYE